MKQLKLVLMVCVTMLFVATSCEKDEKKINVGLEISVPGDVGATLTSISHVELLNKDNGNAINLESPTLENLEAISLRPGIYDITIKALGLNDKKEEVTLVGSSRNVPVSQATSSIKVLLYPRLKGGFVIKEIFYSGATNDKTGKQQKNGADYIIIVNNSDEVLYADSLTFVGTAALTSSADAKYDAALPGKVFADFMFMIPGKGKDHPVQPGEELVLCSEAKNHNELSSQIPDLSKKANFEWYEPNDRFELTDNPAVPNLEILFKTSWSITALHMRGNHSYFILKLPVSKEVLFDKYAELIPYANPSFAPVLRPFIPTEWISDGVELASGENITHKALPETVDLTHTYCSEMRKGYTVQRKELYSKDGRKVYKDDNNSMEDFNRDQPSSLL